VNRTTLKTMGAALLALSIWGTSRADETPRTVRIGIVTDGPGSRGYDITEVLRREILEVCGTDYVVEFPDDAIVDGGWTSRGAADAMRRVLERADIDLVLAVGLKVAALACAAQDLPTPVVVPFAFPGCVPECPRSSMVRINTLDLGRLMARDLRAYREVVPFSRVSVLTEPGLIDTCDTDPWAATIAPEGADVRFVSLEPGYTDIVDDLPPGTDAVYLLRLQTVDDEGFERLVAGLTRAGLPTFSLMGEIEVEQGVLAGLNTATTLRTLARGAGVDVLDLLEGREGEQAPMVDYGAQLTVNLATARALDLGLSWEVLSGAALLHEDAFRRGESVDLRQSLKRAVDANLEVLIQDRRVAAGEENVRDARSVYRPQLDVALNGVAIDSDRAVPALAQYQRFASGSLELTQLIYADDATANITAQREIQEARRSDRETVRLDIARAAASAYLDLMSAEALVHIRQADVDLNRANLDVARLRYSVGSASSAEIHRWQAELAAARAALLDALSTRRLAERQLSRLLDRPATLEWEPRVPGLSEALAVLGGAEDAVLLDTPNGFDQLTTKLVEQGLAGSPELAAIDSAIAAQERAFLAARRASYVPTVGLSAELDQIVAKSEGGGLSLGPITGVDDTLWNVGLRVSLPLTAGGAIKARRIRSDEELRGLRLDRRNVGLKLSQRILSSLDEAAASWPAITLRRESADAAARTLELVQDAYARGAASILDLLDAQNAALTAEFAAETAVYEFLDDWAEVRRSVGELGPGR
jgi:outer membrane protein TolC